MQNSCGEGNYLWEQSWLAIPVPKFTKDRVACIAGKPCSHRPCSPSLAPRGLAPQALLPQVLLPRVPWPPGDCASPSRVRTAPTTIRTGCCGAADCGDRKSVV